MVFLFCWAEYVDTERYRCPMGMVNTLTLRDRELRDEHGQRLFRFNCKFRCDNLFFYFILKKAYFDFF